jgi:hypothetical protein
VPLPLLLAAPALLGQVILSNTVAAMMPRTPTTTSKDRVLSLLLRLMSSPAVTSCTV